MSTVIVDVAFGPNASIFVGQQAVIVVESTSANAFTWANVLLISILHIPSSISRFRFRYEVGEEMTVLIDIRCDFILAGVVPVFLNRNAADLSAC